MKWAAIASIAGQVKEARKWRDIFNYGRDIL